MSKHTILLVFCLALLAFPGESKYALSAQNSNYEWMQVIFGMVHGSYTRVTYKVKDDCYSNAWSVADAAISYTRYNWKNLTWESWMFLISDLILTSFDIYNTVAVCAFKQKSLKMAPHLSQAVSREGQFVESMVGLWRWAYLADIGAMVVAGVSSVLYFLNPNFYFFGKAFMTFITGTTYLIMDFTH